MVEEYWGLKSKPFLNTPDLKFLFRSEDFKEGYARIIYNINEISGGLTLITGEIGCGKTYLANALKKDLKELGHKVIFITNPIFTQTGFVRWIVENFLEDEKVPSRKVKMFEALVKSLKENAGKNRKYIAIIDEAQILKPKVLEEIRLLLNIESEEEKLIQIILLGQPEIEKKIEKMPQIRQRINIRYHIEPMDEDEAIRYIEHRLNVAGAKREIFTKDAKIALYQFSGGIPRNINTLAQNSLFVGYSLKKDVIDKEIIEAVAEDLRMV
uniref:AAA family ATPase n=1 Tax=candidate division WOR-3 bacterium TaxID=2052148 RepID=A0A7C4YF85_UNCW3